MMAHLRSEFGNAVHLLHDVHHRLTPIEAGRLGAALEPYRMFWIEDPTPAEDQSAFRLIRQHTTTPIAVGEVFNSIWDCQQLITERLIDYIRTVGVPRRRYHPPAPDLRSGRPVRRPLRLPRARRPLPDRHGRRLARRPVDPELRHPGVHGAPRRGTRGVRHELHVQRTATCIREIEPGLGVTFDEDAAARFPYDPKYLPVNRRRDGSVHDW